MQTFFIYEMGDVIQANDNGTKFIILIDTCLENDDDYPIPVLSLNSGRFTTFRKEFIEENFEVVRNEKEWVSDKADKMGAEMLGILNGNKIEEGE